MHSEKGNISKVSFVEMTFQSKKDRLIFILETILEKKKRGGRFHRFLYFSFGGE